MGRLKLPLLSLVYFLNSWALADVKYECRTQGVPLYAEGTLLNHEDDFELIFNSSKTGGIPDITVGENAEYLITHKKGSIGVFKKGQESYLLFRVFPTDKAYDLKLPIREQGRSREVRCEIRSL